MMMFAPSLRGARDKIAKQFCADATKQSSILHLPPWIASLTFAMTVKCNLRTSQDGLKPKA